MSEPPSVPEPSAGRPATVNDGVPPPRDAVEAILTDARRIAVVGASDDPGRPSHDVVRTLLEVGYDVVPVNPNARRVHGVPCVASLAEIEGRIDVVDVFRRAEHAPDIVRAAVGTGAWAVWLQLGVRSPEARRIAGDCGLWFVEDRCIAAEARRERHRCTGVDA